MQDYFVIIEEIGIFICVIMVGVLAAQNSSREQKYLMLAGMCVLVENLGYLLQLLTREPDTVLFALKVQSLGISIFSIVIFLFLMAYFGMELPRSLVVFLLAITLLRCLTAWCSGMEEAGVLSTIYYRELDTVMQNGEAVLRPRFGWVYYIGNLIDMLLYIISLICAARKIILMSKQERKNMIYLIFGIAAISSMFVTCVSEMFQQFEMVSVGLVIIYAAFMLMFIKSNVSGMNELTRSELIQKMEQGIIMTDEYYNLVEYNSLAGELFPDLKQLKKGDKISKYFSLMHLLDRNSRQDFQKGDSYYKVQVSTIIENEMIRGYSIWLYDVTETKKYTDELIRLKEQADYSNREKSNFLANMSHEIRTPMNVIIGSTELILREKASDVILENASTIKQAGQNLLGIINDILDFSKIEVGKMEIVPVRYSLEAMVSDLVNMTNVRIGEKELDFIVDVEESLPRQLIGDDIRLKQIIINLLSNAVKFTESGYIRLRIARMQEENSDGQCWLRIDVEDSGIGIKENNLQNLFDSFSRFDTVKNRAVEGTGLGLAISLMLARNMNGRLLVESEYGKGSCFSLEIPQKLVEEEVDSRAKGCYKKALVVEKSEEYRSIYDKAFQNMGIEYAITDSEEQFIEKLDRTWDILFVDKETYASPVIARLKADKVVLLDKLETVDKQQEEDLMVMKQSLGIKLSSILNKTYSSELRSNASALEQEFTAPDARILVVDDNAVNLKIATGLLKPFKMHVDTVNSGKKAIARLEDSEYDIVFMDHMMPEMDGIETTQKIRSRVGSKFQNVVIVALTANAVNGAKNLFLTSGMQDFLSKPIDLKRMTEVLKRWLPEDKIIEKKKNASPELRGFSIEKGLKNFQGDKKQYKIALQVYLMMAERFMQELSDEVQTQNYDGMGKMVQTFAEESSKIGAERMAAFLSKYVQACEDGNEKFVKSNYGFLKKLYDEIAQYLAELTDKL